MHMSGGKPDRKEVRNMSNEVKAYREMVEKAAEECKDLKTLVLVWRLLATGSEEE